MVLPRLLLEKLNCLYGNQCGEIEWDISQTFNNEVSTLLKSLIPSKQSIQSRQRIFNYVKSLIGRAFEDTNKKLGSTVTVHSFGSVPLETYLPDGDLDISIFSGHEYLKDSWHDILQGYMQKIGVDKQEKFFYNGQIDDNSQQLQENYDKQKPLDQEEGLQIKFLGIVNAEVKVAKMIVNDVLIDISFNSVGGVCTLYFLEQIDAIVGSDSLFKKSIILIKSWCYYDSHILGAQHSMISTYALEVLVLYILSKYYKTLQSPLQVFYKFLEVFTNFDWAENCLTLEGIVPISSLRTANNFQESFFSENFLKEDNEQSLLSEIKIQLQVIKQQIEDNDQITFTKLTKGSTDSKNHIENGQDIENNKVYIEKVQNNQQSNSQKKLQQSNADEFQNDQFEHHHTTTNGNLFHQKSLERKNLRSNTDGNGEDKQSGWDNSPQQQTIQAGSFLKVVNIVDPLYTGNNLGRSISSSSFYRIKTALHLGFKMLNQAIRTQDNNLLRKLFNNTYAQLYRYFQEPLLGNYSDDSYGYVETTNKYQGLQIGNNVGQYNGYSVTSTSPNSQQYADVTNSSQDIQSQELLSNQNSPTDFDNEPDLSYEKSDLEDRRQFPALVPQQGEQIGSQNDTYKSGYPIHQKPNPIAKQNLDKIGLSPSDIESNTKSWVRKNATIKYDRNKDQSSIRNDTKSINQDPANTSTHHTKQQRPLSNNIQENAGGSDNKQIHNNYANISKQQDIQQDNVVSVQNKSSVAEQQQNPNQDASEPQQEDQAQKKDLEVLAQVTSKQLIQEKANDSMQLDSNVQKGEVLEQQSQFTNNREKQISKETTQSSMTRSSASREQSAEEPQKQGQNTQQLSLEGDNQITQQTISQTPSQTTFNKPKQQGPTAQSHINIQQHQQVPIDYFQRMQGPALQQQNAKQVNDQIVNQKQFHPDQMPVKQPFIYQPPNATLSASDRQLLQNLLEKDHKIRRPIQQQQNNQLQGRQFQSQLQQQSQQVQSQAQQQQQSNQNQQFQNNTNQQNAQQHQSMLFKKFQQQGQIVQKPNQAPQFQFPSNQGPDFQLILQQYMALQNNIKGQQVFPPSNLVQQPNFQINQQQPFQHQFSGQQAQSSIQPFNQLQQSYLKNYAPYAGHNTIQQNTSQSNDKQMPQNNQQKDKQQSQAQQQQKEVGESSSASNRNQDKQNAPNQNQIPNSQQQSNQPSQQQPFSKQFSEDQLGADQGQRNDFQNRHQHVNYAPDMKKQDQSSNQTNLYYNSSGINSNTNINKQVSIQSNAMPIVDFSQFQVFPNNSQPVHKHLQQDSNMVGKQGHLHMYKQQQTYFTGDSRQDSQKNQINKQSSGSTQAHPQNQSSVQKNVTVAKQKNQNNQKQININQSNPQRSQPIPNQDDQFGLVKSPQHGSYNKNQQFTEHQFPKFVSANQNLPKKQSTNNNNMHFQKAIDEIVQSQNKSQDQNTQGAQQRSSNSFSKGQNTQKVNVGKSANMKDTMNEVENALDFQISTQPSASSPKPVNSKIQSQQQETSNNVQQNFSTQQSIGINCQNARKNQNQQYQSQQDRQDINQISPKNQNFRTPTHSNKQSQSTVQSKPQLQQQQQGNFPLRGRYDNNKTDDISPKPYHQEILNMLRFSNVNKTNPMQNNYQHQQQQLQQAQIQQNAQYNNNSFLNRNLQNSQDFTKRQHNNNNNNNNTNNNTNTNNTSIFDDQESQIQNINFSNKQVSHLNQQQNLQQKGQPQQQKSLQNQQTQTTRTQQQQQQQQQQQNHQAQQLKYPSTNQQKQNEILFNQLKQLKPQANQNQLLQDRQFQQFFQQMNKNNVNLGTSFSNFNNDKDLSSLLNSNMMYFPQGNIFNPDLIPQQLLQNQILTNQLKNPQQNQLSHNLLNSQLQNNLSQYYLPQNFLQPQASSLTDQSYIGFGNQGQNKNLDKPLNQLIGNLHQQQQPFLNLLQQDKFSFDQLNLNYQDRNQQKDRDQQMFIPNSNNTNMPQLNLPNMQFPALQNQANNMDLQAQLQQLQINQNFLSAAGQGQLSNPLNFGDLNKGRNDFNENKRDISQNMFLKSEYSNQLQKIMEFGKTNSQGQQIDVQNTSKNLFQADRQTDQQATDVRKDAQNLAGTSLEPQNIDRTDSNTFYSIKNSQQRQNLQSSGSLEKIKGLNKQPSNASRNSVQGRRRQIDSNYEEMSNHSRQARRVNSQQEDYQTSGDRSDRSRANFNFERDFPTLDNLKPKQGKGQVQQINIEDAFEKLLREGHFEKFLREGIALEEVKNMFFDQQLQNNKGVQRMPSQKQNSITKGNLFQKAIDEIQS